MKFSFKDKTIFLLSPERWGGMRISKHHYAMELAGKGNDVYFIEPPDLDNKRISVTTIDEHPRLYIVKYKPIYRGKRYLPSVVYRRLVQWQIRRLIKAVGHQPDVVLCFDPYRFLNLKWFRSSAAIFFAADLFNYEFLPEEALTADFCLGVSDTIVETLRKGIQNVHFINHGLSHFFKTAAEKNLQALNEKSPVEKEHVTIGYVGNLLMEAPDRSKMQEVVAANPYLKFIFWGPYEAGGNIGSFQSASVTSFIEFLKAQPNVVLRGAVHPSVLSEECKQADIFWICWRINQNNMWDGSNSHKILEYLSMGKPVVSHYMSTYESLGLIDMLNSKSNEGYSDLFTQVIHRVKKGESPGKQRERILFAISNTYQSQIQRIEDLIQQYCR